MSWSNAPWAVLALVFLVGYYFFYARRGNANSAAADDGFDTARFQSDRSDPRKLWAHAAIGLYQDDSDPGCWKPENALRRLQKGWSTPDRAELVALIQRYIDGECNVAFDKLRIIFLARTGRGAGWFDEATSWAYAFDAITEIQKHCASWEQLRVGMDEGRADWYGGKGKVPQAQMELSDRGWDRLKNDYMSQVPFKGA